MRIMAWNIRQGGRSHPDIEPAIVKHSPDVVVLGEYHSGSSDPLIDSLASRGWAHAVRTSPPPARGGLAIVSRHEIHRETQPSPLESLSSRYLPVTIGELRIRGLYGVLEGEKLSDTYWPAVLEALAADADEDVVVVGDFNTGRSLADAPQKKFYCSEYFDQLPARGYVDLWRQCAGEEAREYSWHGPANPYRLDHAFGSRSVAARKPTCVYSHAEREEKLSDHSILLVDIPAASRS